MTPLFDALAAARMVTALLLAACSAAHAQVRLDAAASAYLASAQFTEILLETLSADGGDPAACRNARVHLSQVSASQEIVMADGAHPESGLWRVAFDAEGCGSPGIKAVTLRAVPGARPLVLGGNG